MKNNKVILSLVVATIAAMATVPELLKKDKSDDSKKDVIDLSIGKARTDEQKQIAADVKGQVDTILSKKTPATKVGESVDILVSNYGTKDQNIKHKIYDDLKLTQAMNQDSTSVVPGTYTATRANTVNTSAPTVVSCHGACHSNCHSACHGSRGWRKAA